jgi:hypothetical protein
VCILEYKRLSIQILKKKGGSLINMYIYLKREVGRYATGRCTRIQKRTAQIFGISTGFDEKAVFCKNKNNG